MAWEGLELSWVGVVIPLGLNGGLSINSHLDRIPLKPLLKILVKLREWFSFSLCNTSLVILGTTDG